MQRHWPQILPVIGAAALALALVMTQSATSDTANAPPLSPPAQGLRVYHLGHSLVGQDMPAMLEQLAQAQGFTGHHHNSQLGWGTPLRAHWEPEVEIGGFEAENDHPRFRPAHEAISSGAYDAVVLTEMVELRDAIRYHDSPRYLALWVEAARAANPDVRLYLYKTWHDLAHDEGWLPRLENDPTELWEAQLLASVWADPALGPLHVIPATGVLAELTRRLQAGETAPGLSRPEDLFRINPDGALDTMHLNDQGNYLIALTHFAVLYQQPAQGMPYALLTAAGDPMAPIAPAAAALLQEVVDAVLAVTPNTGLTPRAAR
ncbi:hypothetical protein [Pararhodobacter oceanensis]|uniref:hypothetical protein n=1 Tax=Pararhodobacter oceanensis TaxID=2172121 RepID=UPI003A8F6104